jgi:hypothetical protein
VGGEDHPVSQFVADGGEDPFQTVSHEEMIHEIEGHGKGDEVRIDIEQKLKHCHGIDGDNEKDYDNCRDDELKMFYRDFISCSLE